MNRWFSDEEKIILAIVFGVTVLVWAVVAFSLVGLYVVPPTARAVAPPLSVYAAAATGTPTLVSIPPPSLPTLAPTATETVVPLPTSSPTPVPTPTRPSEPGILPGSDTLVIAILGAEDLTESSVWRTDTIILVFVQHETKRMAMLSIPRDLWVRIPGYGYNRINTVDALGERSGYPGGGPGLLNQTLRDNLGIRIDHYVRVGFGGFVRVVDHLGGVTVEVEKPLTDWFPDPLSAIGYSRITLQPGPKQLNGRMALSYCRSRMTTSDFDRSRRQQQVIMALWRKAFTPQMLPRAPVLWNEFKDSFQTDLTMAEAIQLGYDVQSIGPENVQTQNLDFATAKPWVTPRGAQVLLPQTAAIQQIVRDMLYPTE